MVSLALDMVLSGVIGFGHGFTMVSLALDMVLYGVIGFGHDSSMVSLALGMVLQSKMNKRVEQRRRTCMPTTRHIQ